MLNAALYFHTLRYLRPIQIYGRLWHKLYRTSPDLSPPPTLRPLSGAWRKPAQKGGCGLRVNQPSRFLGLVSGTVMGGLNTGTDLMSESVVVDPVLAVLGVLSDVQII